MCGAAGGPSRQVGWSKKHSFFVGHDCRGDIVSPQFIQAWEKGRAILRHAFRKDYHTSNVFLPIPHPSYSTCSYKVNTCQTRDCFPKLQMLFFFVQTLLLEETAISMLFLDCRIKTPLLTRQVDKSRSRNSKNHSVLSPATVTVSLLFWEPDQTPLLLPMWCNWTACDEQKWTHSCPVSWVRKSPGTGQLAEGDECRQALWATLNLSSLI